jgi:hypothetical protein
MISVRLMTAIFGCYTKTLSPIARYVLEEVGFLQFSVSFRGSHAAEKAGLNT